MSIPTPKAPGVFVEEIAPERIPTLPSSTTLGIAGFTLKGPTDKATIINTFDEFLDRFGSTTPLSLVPLTVRTYFENGGRRAVVVRVASPGSLLAKVDVDSPPKFRIDATSVGSWANNVTVTIEGNADALDTTGALPVWRRFNVAVAEFEPAFGVAVPKEAFSSVSLTNPDDPSFVTVVVNDELIGSKLVRFVSLAPAVPAGLLASQITGEVIGVGDGVTKKFTATLTSPPVFEGSLDVFVGTVLKGEDDKFGLITGVGMDPAGVNLIDYETGEITVTFLTAPTTGDPVKVNYIRLPRTVTFILTGGSDGPTPGVIFRSQVSAPSLENLRKGIFSFDEVEEFMNLTLPDFINDTTGLVFDDLVSFAEKRRDKFVVWAIARGKTPKQAVDFLATVLTSTSQFAAVYYPWVKIIDPDLQNFRVFPPVGPVIGAYARTDLTKTFAKVAAGVEDGRLINVLSVETLITKKDRELLSQARINPIIFDAPSGAVTIFGARTLSRDAFFGFINARRTLSFVGRSLAIEARRFLFENNGPPLWLAIRTSFVALLENFFKQGAFAGNTPNEAFRIVVDDTNNTQQDIEKGIVNIDVGVALFRPAEFVIIRIRQKVGQTTTT